MYCDGVYNISFFLILYKPYKQDYPAKYLWSVMLQVIIVSDSKCITVVSVFFNLLFKMYLYVWLEDATDHLSVSWLSFALMDDCELLVLVTVLWPKS